MPAPGCCLPPARLLGLLLLVAAGCHHAARRDSPARPPVPVAGGTEFVLQVINHHWLDVDVYILHNGQRTHVGTVTATTTQSFVLTARLLGASRQIALLADAIGSPNLVRTETLLVQPGQFIEWTLETDLRRSSVGVY